MVDALGGLLADGRLKLYCVSSYDSQSWMSGVDARGGGAPARLLRVVDRSSV